MRNYRQLSTFTLALLFLSGAFNPFNFFTVEALAACTIANEVENELEIEPEDSVSGPEDNDEVICNDEDTAGINAPDATNVTVTVTSPDGNISVTDTPGILLGDDATVTVVGPGGAVTVEGNSVPGIQVGNMTDVTDRANITISGTVATTGDLSSAIVTGDNATIRIDGGEGRQEIVDGETDDAETEVITVPDRGIISTAGQQSVAVSVGANSMVRAVGLSQISTTGADSDAVMLNGDDSQLLVGENATVATEGNRSNAVQMAGVSSRLTVEGTVRSEAQNTTTVMSTGDNAVIEVRSGGVVTALASDANAIETTGTDARITIREGGEVTVASDDSAAIVTVSGDARVTVQGTVSAAGDRSQGIVLGDDASLTVEATGRIETSSATARAVVIDEMASSADVNVDSNGIIDAGSGQAIVDVGSTNTDVTVDGRVIGGGGAPVLALGGGDDEVIVNGSISSTGSATVIDLGSGNDTLNDNSSQTISGSGVLASGADGTETLNLSNGKINDSADYQQFEITNVGTNTNTDDPLNGMGSTLTVTDDQSGNQINVASGSTLNVRSGGTVDLRADGTNNPSGVPGNTIAFDSGATANVQVENVTGTQPVQNFTNTTFASGTAVSTSSGFIRGIASNDENTGIGQIELSSDFTHSARTSNGTSIGEALNALADRETLTTDQQEALNTLIAEASDTNAGEAVLASISGEVNAQAAASGINAARHFNDVLLPSGNRVDSRGATIATDPNRAGRVFEQPAVGNGVWVSGLGSLLDVNRNDDSTAFDASTYGVAVGYDRAAELGTFGTAVFGVGAGYASTAVNGVSDDATVNAFSLGTYLEGAKGPLSGHVAASYSSQDISSDRSSGGSGNLFVLSSEAFYNLQPDAGLAVGPIGRLGAAFGSYEGFSTESDAFGIDYDGADVSQVTGAVGVRIGGQNPVNVGLMALNLDLLYESSLGDNTIQFDGKMGESDVSIASPTTNQSGFYIGAEAALAISDNSSVGFRYQGNLGSDIQAHTGEFKFSLLF